MSTIVYTSGICYLSVCTDDTDEVAVATADQTHPTGLDHGWSIADEPFRSGQPNPSSCELDGSRRHLLLSC